MLPTGMPSLALIRAYGTGGSLISSAIGCQNVLEHGGLVVRDVVGVYRLRGGVWRRCPVQDALAFPPGCGGEPAREQGRIADLAELVHQLQPDVLAGVAGAGAVQPVPAA